VLIEYIKDKYKTISIVGMSKNSGKTVTLNHLIGEAMYEDITIGITSIGRDGEGEDVVTETEKPRIYVENGTLVATAKEMLALGDANVEILQVTDHRTPMGNIVIGRVRSSGYIQIAGPQLLSEIREVSETMLSLGAEFVIIDGALDRITSADPRISEATILATGAVVSRDMGKTIEETSHVASLLALPTIDNNHDRTLLREIIKNDQIAIVDEDNSVRVIPIKTALNAGGLIGEHLKDQSKYIVIPGSLVKKTILDITRSTRKYKDVDIVISDGTKVFIGPKDWLIFKRQGVRVKVLDKINLIAITINPFAPQGYYFNPEDYLRTMQSYIKDVPVVDLVLGGE